MLRSVASVDITISTDLPSHDSTGPNRPKSVSSRSARGPHRASSSTGRPGTSIRARYSISITIALPFQFGQLISPCCSTARGAREPNRTLLSIRREGKPVLLSLLDPPTLNLQPADELPKIPPVAHRIAPEFRGIALMNPTLHQGHRDMMSPPFRQSLSGFNRSGERLGSHW